jgi:hypothetical protein
MTRWPAMMKRKNAVIALLEKGGTIPGPAQIALETVLK